MPELLAAYQATLEPQIDDTPELLQPSQNHPNITRGGIITNSFKSFGTAFSQVHLSSTNIGKAKNLKGKICSPILVAAFGKMAVEKFEAGDIEGGLSATTQGLMIGSSNLGLFNHALKAAFKTKGGKIVEEGFNLFKVKAVLRIGGKETPVIGLIFSEVGTLIGVVERAANGDLPGAAGDLVVGSAGNLVAEAIPVPGINFAISETAEALLAYGINKCFHFKKPVNGSTLVAAANELFGPCKIVSRAEFDYSKLDAEGKPILPGIRHFLEKNEAPISSLTNNNLLPKDFITEQKEAYIKSVEKALKANNDHIMDKILKTNDFLTMNEIIIDLNAAFNTPENNPILKGSKLDKELEAHNIRVDSWIRY